jgi:hypothetical protein
MFITIEHKVFFIVWKYKVHTVHILHNTSNAQIVFTPQYSQVILRHGSVTRNLK